MSVQKIMIQRIHKEIKQIQLNPLDNIIVAKTQLRQFHFCIFGLQSPYQNGFYHGILQLPQNYPFSAPKFKFFTNNGRFEAGSYVCTTFTSYHQQQWSSSWTVRTILIAILSFFLSQSVGYGSLKSSQQKRNKLAVLSLQQNLSNQTFRELFLQKLNELKLIKKQLKPLKQQLKPVKQQLKVVKKILQVPLQNRQIKMKQISLQTSKSDVNTLIQQNDSIGLNISCLIEQTVFLKEPQRRNRRNSYILKILYSTMIILIIILVILKI